MTTQSSIIYRLVYLTAAVSRQHLETCWTWLFACGNDVLCNSTANFYYLEVVICVVYHKLMDGISLIIVWRYDNSKKGADNSNWQRNGPASIERGGDWKVLMLHCHANGQATRRYLHVRPKRLYIRRAWWVVWVHSSCRGWLLGEAPVFVKKYSRWHFYSFNPSVLHPQPVVSLPRHSVREPGRVNKKDPAPSALNKIYPPWP